MSDPDDYERMLREGAASLGQRRRAAFAGACAERTRALYESTSSDDDDWYFDAMLPVWLFALDKPVEPAAIAAGRAEATRRRDALIDEQDTGYTLAAVETLLAALEAIDDDGLDSLISAAMSAVDAASQTTSDDDHGQEAEAEEEAFQARVLEILDEAPDRPCDLTAFGVIGWTSGEGWPEARWLTRLETDDAW